MHLPLHDCSAAPVKSAVTVVQVAQLLPVFAAADSVRLDPGRSAETVKVLRLCALERDRHAVDHACP